MLSKFKNGAIWFFKSFIWLFILMLALDLISKLCVVNFLKTPGTTVELIPGFLNVTYVVNTNAAFGVGFGDATANRAMYIVLASIASLVVIAIFIKKYKKLTGMYKATMMLILTGAIGNLIDRIFYSPEFLHNDLNGVVDWIEFKGIWKYVFNWADSCIVVGCIMLIIYLIVLEVKEKKANRVQLAKEVKNSPTSSEETNAIADEALSNKTIKENDKLSNLDVCKDDINNSEDKNSENKNADMENNSDKTK